MASLSLAEMFLQWFGIVFLVSLSALFAGLTLGLMSLDITGLEIVIASGSPKESAYARKIYPIRSRGNLLLCTLLLGNVSVNALLSILMADLTSGLVGFLLSTFIIVVFGEIVPQAACSRHGLAVGAHTAWIVYFFLFLFFPFAYPISFALDYFLGREMGTIYNRNELKKLLDIHSIHQGESGVSRKDALILSGVLDYAAKKVEQIMTPIDSVFMLDIESKLDLNLLTFILERGHSRIPVYERDRSNIVSSMLVKDLAIVNPEEGLSLRSFLGFYGRELPKLKHDRTLDYVLNEFKTGKSHMALVVKSTTAPLNESTEDISDSDVTIGVVTLEDVIEEILQDEIMDENDVNRQKKSEDSKYKKYTSFKGAHLQVSPQQMVAITSFLSTSLPEFSKKNISDDAFKYLIRNSTILEFDKAKDEQLIYSRGIPHQMFTLVLQGKLEIRSGSEGFYSECGPFSYLGLDALKSDSFVPGFSAKVMTQVQLLQIKKKVYDTALQMTTQGRQQQQAQPRKLNVPEPKNFTDSVEFVERKDTTGLNGSAQANNKDKKGNVTIALKALKRNTPKKEEMQSLMKENSFLNVAEEDLEEYNYVQGKSLVSEEDRLKRLGSEHNSTLLIVDNTTNRPRRASDAGLRPNPLL